MTGREVTITCRELLHLTWLKSCSPKTAGRYVESAMKSIICLLGECLSDLFELISVTPAPVSTVAIKKSDDALDLRTLIDKHTMATCSLSSSAYGIQIPIPECVGRYVQARREPHAVKSEHLPNYLANGIGTIAGLLGSGRSVLLQSIALLGNQKNLYLWFLVLSLVPVRSHKPACKGRMRTNWIKESDATERLQYMCSSCGEIFDTDINFTWGDPY